MKMINKTFQKHRLLVKWHNIRNSKQQTEFVNGSDLPSEPQSSQMLRV
jgi:hypothetical protein